jgi:hypothetical protein
MYVFLEPYPRTQIPRQFRDDWWRINPIEKRDASIDWVTLFSNINRTASPGIPYHVLGSTNGVILDNYSELIKQIVMERLTLLASTRYNLRRMTPAELVTQGFTDPIRVFVKNEIHKKSKVESGKVRLISSVSLVDQIIERLLFADQNQAEIRDHFYIPSKPGFGMLEEASVEQIRQHIELMKDIGPLVSTDMSTWDFTMQEWEYAAEFKMRAILNHADSTDDWTSMARHRLLCLSNSIFALSDGRLYSQRMLGVMKSGSYLTSSTNSRVRAFIAFLRGSPSITMGDDCIEVCRNPQSLIDHYHRLGHHVKEVNEVFETFEFCSHQFGKKTIVPVNWMKTIINFLLKKDFTDASIRQLNDELKDLNRFLVRDVFDRAGYSFLAKSF